MTPNDFQFLRILLRDRSGLMLPPEKQYLVESRLAPVARRNAIADLGALTAELRKSPHGRLESEVVEAMTTNESFFFRDKVPFEHFRQVIMPALLAGRARERRIRIWCNAASSGQEPYSLAMILDEMKPLLRGWTVDILATDISTAMLEKAKAGIYSQFEVQRGLPIQLLVKHFTQADASWQISQALRDAVRFVHFNLLGDFHSLGTFDVVFCRNVLIYFDQDTKTKVFNRLARSVAPDGFLLLGAAETVVGLTDAFKPLPDHRSLYVVNRDAAALKYLNAPPIVPAAAPRTLAPAKPPA